MKLKLTLSPDGEVLAATATLGNPILAEAARANILLWKFEGLRSTEESPPKTIEVTYDFRIMGEVTARPTTHFRYEHPYKVSVVSQALHWMPQTEN